MVDVLRALHRLLVIDERKLVGTVSAFDSLPLLARPAPT
jgi:hypothetical protein